MILVMTEREFSAYNELVAAGMKPRDVLTHIAITGGMQTVVVPDETEVEDRGLAEPEPIGAEE